MFTNKDGEVSGVKIATFVGGGIIALILIAIFNPFVIISAGERGVIMEFGKVSDKILGEGLNTRIPIQQTIKILNVQVQKEEISVSAASKDLQNVNTVIALNYHLFPDKVNTLWREIPDYKEKRIDPSIQEAVKAATAEYTAEELITKREAVREKIRALLHEKLVGYYVSVDDVSIVNFDFSKAFNEAIESKVTAEQNALAAKNKLEQVKFEAEQRIAQAKGEAEAIRIQAQAITQQGGKDYVNLKWVEAWRAGGALVPQTIIGEGGGNFLFNIK